MFKTCAWIALSAHKPDIYFVPQIWPEVFKTSAWVVLSAALVQSCVALTQTRPAPSNRGLMAMNGGVGGEGQEIGGTSPRRQDRGRG